MGLFGKKKPVEYCAVCGKERKTGLLRGLFQVEVDGHYVCGDCFNDVDVQKDIFDAMTIDQFRDYVAFQKENKKLGEQFNTTTDVDLGGWDNHVYFDRDKALMTLDRTMAKTFFQRGSLQSFVIREDDCVIFEGSSKGLLRQESRVPGQMRELELEIAMYHRERRAHEARLSRMSAEDRERERSYGPTFYGSAPMEKFYVELYFDHPYWRERIIEVGGPGLSNSDPDAAEYLEAYHTQYEAMNTLAKELMAFGFPGAGEISANAAAPVAASAAASQADAADALKKFKELLDMGVITQEEFDAKKRQLLGL